MNRWRALFEQYGEDGLKPQTRGRCDWKADEAILAKLESLLESSPADQGYLRSRWSSELLAKVLFEHTGVAVHGSTVRRWLARLSYGYRRARPTLFIRDPRKTQRMRAIRRALKNQSKDNEVLYVDEADVDLNPRIGPAWMDASRDPNGHCDTGEEPQALRCRRPQCTHRASGMDGV